MRQKVTKAIFPVAGLGTRFLPATKSIPKEVLPLVDRPLIQYCIDEARAAGIKEFIFVTSRGKSALEDYFDNAPQLEKTLRQKGKTELLEELRQTDMESGAIAYIRQKKAKGLGHAVACAHRFIANEPFAVLLPDDVIAADKPCLQQMVEAWEETRGNMVGVMEVPEDQISSYGVLDVKEDMNRLVTARGMVEKPTISDAPSRLAVVGRYILTPSVMRALRRTDPGVGGEIQLTDAINSTAMEEDNVYGYRFEGTRYDCGSKAGFLEATVDFALRRPELRDRFTCFLRQVTEAKPEEKQVVAETLKAI
jgi:UTP--glucose-1-phosphate uridylyltransferase